MSFGWGPASQMNKTVQKLRRPRRDNLSKVGDLVKKGDSKITDKKASQKQLDEIREKLQQENKVRFRRNIIIFIVAMATIIYVIGFVKF